MDPNTALANLRKLAKEILNLEDKQQAQDLSLEIATQFQALDTWLFTGGFLPSEWVSRAPASKASTLDASQKTG